MEAQLAKGVSPCVAGFSEVIFFPAKPLNLRYFDKSVFDRYGRIVFFLGVVNLDLFFFSSRNSYSRFFCPCKRVFFFVFETSFTSVF